MKHRRKKIFERNKTITKMVKGRKFGSTEKCKKKFKKSLFRALHFIFYFVKKLHLQIWQWKELDEEKTRREEEKERGTLNLHKVEELREYQFVSSSGSNFCDFAKESNNTLQL
jgi:hypothetical protein